MKQDLARLQSRAGLDWYWLLGFGAALPRQVLCEGTLQNGQYMKTPYCSEFAARDWR